MRWKQRWRPSSNTPRPAHFQPFPFGLHSLEICSTPESGISLHFKRELSKRLVATHRPMKPLLFVPKNARPYRRPRETVSLQAIYPVVAIGESTFVRAYEMDRIFHVPIWSVFVGTLFLALASVEVGYRWAGKRQDRRDLEKEAPLIAHVNAAVGFISRFYSRPGLALNPRIRLRSYSDQNRS